MSGMLVSKSCTEGKHDKCRANALTCGCAHHQPGWSEPITPDERQIFGVEEGPSEVWSVVAPKGHDQEIAAAVEVVLAEHPDAGGIELSERIAAKVPSARVGPMASDEPEPDLPPIDTAPEPDVVLVLSDHDRNFLQYLVDESEVLTSISDIAASMIASGIDMARDEINLATRWALMYVGGLTQEEKDALNEAAGG